MSGHGGFIQLDNNRPISSVNIGNVENIQKQEDVKQQPLNVEDEQQQVATEKTNTREMVKQLDVLLLQVAQASTKGIDAKALKGKVSDLGLSKNELSALNTLIDQAANSLKALDKFTGRELVFATTRDNNLAYVWDTNDAAGKAIKTALAHRLHYRKNSSNSSAPGRFPARRRRLSNRRRWRATAVRAKSGRW